MQEEDGRRDERRWERGIARGIIMNAGGTWKKER